MDLNLDLARVILRSLVVAATAGSVMTISSAEQSPAELIIQVRPGVSEQQVRELSQRLGADYQYALGGPAYLIRVPDVQRAMAITERLRAQPEVTSVEPNQAVRIPE
jgi:hypothetical protein